MLVCDLQTGDRILPQKIEIASSLGSVQFSFGLIPSQDLRLKPTEFWFRSLLGFKISQCLDCCYARWTFARFRRVLWGSLSGFSGTGDSKKDKSMNKHHKGKINTWSTSYVRGIWNLIGWSLLNKREWAVYVGKVEKGDVGRPMGLQTWGWIGTFRLCPDWS